MRSKYFLILVSLLAVLAAASLLESCKIPGKGGNDPVDPPVTKTDFTRNPPIAKDVFIQKLDNPGRDGNFLLTATFEGNQKDKLSTASTFTLNPDKNPLVLRDDGRNGDSKANDGIFSARVNISEDVLRSKLRLAQEKASRIENNTITWFQARQAFTRPIDPRLLDPKILDLPFERLDLGSLIDVLLLPDPKLETHSLMITHTDVIDDPNRTIPNPCSATPADANKPWTFAKLMTDMANVGGTGVNVSDFTLNWLEQWLFHKNINGDIVEFRKQMESQVIDPWKAKSNFAATGKLDMHLAPFKLIAIVNRMDLGGSTVYGASDAGEGRFVFGVLDANCNPMKNFTVIFEYGIPIKGCQNIKAYAKQWYDLKDLALGSAAYNTALEAITDQFALANTSPSKPNGSSLNQIRTNENRLNSLWELREFVICDDPTDPHCIPNHLKMKTVNQEPDAKYNRLTPGSLAADRKILADWANAATPLILSDVHAVPEIDPISGHQFLGGHSLPRSPGYFWDAEPAPGANSITNDEARHKFSLATCGGCHARETNTGFTHVTPPGALGGTATLSGFLTGVNVTDPANRPSGSPAVRHFDDLLNRAIKLEARVTDDCFTIFDQMVAVKIPPTQFVH